MLSYDALPYDTKPSFLTHPDRLGAVARLYGIDAAPPSGCRVLEIGCGTGGNLIPMAEALPGSTFVGFDLSAVQIEMGRREAHALGLENLRLLVADLTSWEPEAPFDYVIAHGIYSWLPDNVRDALMGLIRRCLHERSVALVSYNCLPGWRIRGTLRDLLRASTDELEDPHARVEAARALLDTLADSTPSDPLMQLVKRRAIELRKGGDSYLLHDYLADDNHPVWFREFVEHADRHGMTWVSEAELGSGGSAHLSPGDHQLLEAMPDDGVAGYQNADFVRGRAFRRSVLCLDTAPLGSGADPERLRGLHLTGRLRPQHSAGDLTDESVLSFALDGEPVMSTETPMLKAALVELAAHMPRAVSFDALCDGAWHQLGQDGRCPDEARDYLVQTLWAVVTHNFAEVSCRAALVATQLGPRPVAWSVARAQAASGSPFACNLLHQPVAIDATDATLLTLLDGSRDRAALLRDARTRLPDLDDNAAQAALTRLVVAGFFARMA